MAGLGTRFLPATKANPKEMLPVVDKPLIQYAVEEALSAGIEELIFVTSYSKRAIEDHFDSNYELESELAKRGKHALLKQIQNIVPDHVTCVYVRQKEALGLGHAVLCAKNLVGNAPFAVLLADDLIDGGQQTCLSQMVEVFHQSNASVIAVQEIKPEESRQYGVVDTPHIQKRVGQLQAVVEKPDPKEAPSNLGVVGRYVLTPKIFELLETTQPGSGNEIQLTDAISALIHEEIVQAYQFEGIRYDCGSKLGYLEATIAYALKHPELSENFQSILQKYA